MIKKLLIALYADENIVYFNEDYGNVVFNCNKMCILNLDLNNISLDNNFDEGNPDTIIFIRLLAWHIKFKKRKALKEKLNEELMPIVWHPKRWWNVLCQKMRKWKQNQFLLSNAFNISHKDI